MDISNFYRVTTEHKKITIDKKFGGYSSKRNGKSVHDIESSSISSLMTMLASTTGNILRTLLLDLPLLAALLAYATSQWVGHVHLQYLIPQLQSLVFDTERAEEEMTYYQRECTVEDMTTFNGSDLFLPVDATAEEAYQHQLRHGFTVFRNTLQPQTASNLRQFIDSRNRNLREQDKIFVIEGDHRFSFGLGTEEPTVLAAVKEIANSVTLRPALEAVLGPDPALIEMTAITASYGAVDQRWHPDIIPSGSAINYARAFGPSFSLFIQLQNTTAAMGATGACPGTHYCSGRGMKQFCNTSGFQLVDSDGQWHAGDSLLMNMNSWHRGAAHTDPNGLDRVMFILTFVPRPVQRAESRQLSQGITFSLRWDMWGHTLNDLASADTVMKQPWSTLRALGLYKIPNTSWGIDYVSSACMRMANNDNGFKQEDLEKWISFDGFSFLPNWLEGHVNLEKGESWYSYYTRTLNNVTMFLEKCCIIGVFGYLSFFAFMSASRFQITTISRLNAFVNAVVRVASMSFLAYILLTCTKKHVDESEWALDIRAHRRYVDTAPLDRLAFNDETPFRDVDSSPTTFPTRHDVLVETRYGSEQLAMYNDFVNGHPGNRYFLEVVAKQSRTFGDYPTIFQDATAQFIINSITHSNGRFLLQGPDGHWLWMTFEDSMLYTKKELAKSVFPGLKSVLQKIRFLSSDNKYGKVRSTALSKQSNRYLWYLERNLINCSLNKHNKAISAKVDFRNPRQDFEFSKQFMLHSELAKITDTRLSHQHARLSFLATTEKPAHGVWLAAGDAAESYEDGFWYYGTLHSVTALGNYRLTYPGGEHDVVSLLNIRSFVQYRVDEELQFLSSHDGSYYDAIVVATKPHLKVYVEELDSFISVRRLDQVCRLGERMEKQVPHEEERVY